MLWLIITTHTSCLNSNSSTSPDLGPPRIDCSTARAYGLNSTLNLICEKRWRPITILLSFDWSAWITEAAIGQTIQTMKCRKLIGGRNAISKYALHGERTWLVDLITKERNSGKCSLMEVLRLKVPYLKRHAHDRVGITSLWVFCFIMHFIIAFHRKRLCVCLYLSVNIRMQCTTVWNLQKMLTRCTFAINLLLWKN